MHSITAFSVVLAAALTIASPLASPQGVTQAIPAPGGTPAGCLSSVDGRFGITAVKVHSDARRRDVDGVHGEPVRQIGDGQVQNHSPSLPPPPPPAPPVTQIHDGQPQAPTHTPSPPPAQSGSSNGPTNPPSHGGAPPPKHAVCETDSTLSITLHDGILKDRKGRIGYIASNYQFQFDNPPQAGSLYTAGWSICENGLLALGGSTTFWECLSGDFYNLYTENWAAQCHAVIIEVLELKAC